MPYVILLAAFACLVQDDPAAAARTWVEKLGSDVIEEREEAVRRLREIGAPALPFLETAAEGKDAVVAARAKSLIQLIRLRTGFSSGFIAAFPDADRRLAGGDAAAWSELFVEAAERPGDVVTDADLGVLAVRALEGAKGPIYRKVCESLGRRRVKVAVPAMIETIRRQKNCEVALAKALGEIGDPAAVPILLDYPNQIEECLIGDTQGVLAKFGEKAFPEFERRVLDWRGNLSGDRATGLRISLELLGSKSSDSAKKARLDLLSHLVNLKLDYDPNGRHIGEILVFATAVRLIAPDHPDRVLQAMGSCVDRPQVFVQLMAGWHQVPVQVARPVVTGLLTRLRSGPDVHERVRQTVMSHVSRIAPEVLVNDPAPASSVEEAFATINSLRHDSPHGAVDRALARVEKFLEVTPDPRVQVSLGARLFEAGDLEKTVALMDAALAKLAGTQHYEVQAHLLRAEARLRLGDGTGAEVDFQKALDLRSSQGNGGTDDIKRRLSIIATHAPVAGARWRLDVKLKAGEVQAPTWSWGYMETAEERAFFIGGGHRICAADPGLRKAILFPGESSPIRDYMPLDGRRVFVARQDGSAALYEAGKDRAVWTIKLPLGFRSCLTASPRAITAAEENGTFRVLAPESGKTLWTRQVAGRAWPETWWRSERGLYLQGGDRIAIGNRSSVEIADLLTGETVATVKLEFEVAKLFGTKDHILIVGAKGDVVLAAFKDGARTWSRKVEAVATYPVLDISACPDTTGGAWYVAYNDRVFALGAAGGATKWEWRWKHDPASGELDVKRHRPWPEVLAIEDGLFCVINWETTLGNYKDRSDVALLSLAGEPLFQKTAPPLYDVSSAYAQYPFIQGRRLVFHRGGWEIWERAK